MDFNQAHEAIQKLLEACEIPYNNETEEQLSVFLTALRLYSERDKNYGSVWKQYGALSNLVRSATKADRLMEVWWHNEDQNWHDDPLLHKDALDDAFDLINYITFFIRCARQGNFTGTPRQRPEPVDG